MDRKHTTPAFQWDEFTSHLRDNKASAVLVGCGIAIGVLLFFGSNGAFDGLITPYNSYYRNLAPQRIGLILLGGGSGFALGWFFSPQAAVWRYALLGAFVGTGLLLAFADHGALGWSAAWFGALTAFTAGFGYWTARVVQRLTEKPTSMGSASWATAEDLIDHNIVGEDGFRIGFFDHGKGTAPLHYEGDRHLLTVAPNRSGKGTTAIVPNLLTYEGSVVVIDPKGENAMMTAEHRKAMGQEVHVVDPWGITGLEPSRFNPMDWLVQGDIDIGENASLLADAIIMPMGENEQFWTEEGKALDNGVTLHVATDPEEAGQRNLGRVRDLLCLDGEDLTKLFKRMLQSEHHIVRTTGARCLQKEEKLLANVLASVQAQTHFLDSSRIRESLSASDFDFADLKTKPMTIYLVLPSDRLNAFGRWLRLLIQQALTVNARNIEQKPEKSVLFILDEMPALGRLTMVEQAFGLMAGFGMQLWGIVQDLSQLKRIYGDGYETFIANAGVIQYFGSRDRMTAEYFSALCGVTTVWNLSTAIARAFGQTSGATGSSSKTTTTTDTASGTQRKLAFADELMRLPKDRQLLLIENMNPIMATKQPWFENSELKDLGRDLTA